MLICAQLSFPLLLFLLDYREEIQRCRAMTAELTNKKAAALIQGPIRWLHLNRQPITRQFCQEQFAIILLHFMEVKNSMKLQNSILDLETERQDCVNKPNKLFLNPINSFYRNKYPFEYKFVLIVNY